MTDDLRGLRLAVLAPISRPTPPPGYGPWEQVAGDIAAGMVARGLDVTLFATGDSRTPARLSSVVPRGLAEDRGLDDEVCSALHTAALFARAGEFDLIHNSFDWKPLTYALATPAPPLLTTIHGFSRPPILAAYYAAAARSFYCSISDSDRDPGLAYVSTAYNGIDPSAFTFRDRPGDYLVFLGRFHEEKGAHLAIEIARRAGVRLKLAAIPQDEEYFRTRIAPHIDGDRVQFLGEVERDARDDVARRRARARAHDDATRTLRARAGRGDGLRHAGARRADGLDPGDRRRRRHGFLCDDVEQAVARVPQLAGLDRAACRARVEAEFTVERMVDRYCDAYRAVLAAKIAARRRRRSSRAGARTTIGTGRWPLPRSRRSRPRRPDRLRRPREVRARRAGALERLVDRRREHGEVAHLAAQRGVRFAVHVQLDVGVAQHLARRPRDGRRSPAPRMFIMTAGANWRGSTSGRSQIARTCASYCEICVASSE